MSFLCGCSGSRSESLPTHDGMNAIRGDSSTWLSMAEAESRCRALFDAMVARITVFGLVFMVLAFVLVVASFFFDGPTSLSISLWT